MLIQTLNKDKFNHIFDLNVTECNNYDDIFGINTIAKWVDENKNNFFVKVKKEFSTNNIYGGNESSIIWPKLNIPRWNPVSIYTDLDIVFHSLKLRANPKFPSVCPYQCNVIFLISRYNLRLFYSFISFKEVSWDSYEPSYLSKWNSIEFMYHNYEERKKDISNISIEFNSSVEKHIRSLHKIQI
ncbi:hypothetical protein [Dethiothermospora halolimnae]|uniref:hypothetical protein n=1 Tax=Dethiothermospora halolimnae TaxID=3114390 RepID=UPI003CCC08FA